MWTNSAIHQTTLDSWNLMLNTPLKWIQLCTVDCVLIAIPANMLACTEWSTSCVAIYCSKYYVVFHDLIERRIHPDDFCGRDFIKHLTFVFSWWQVRVMERLSAGWTPQTRRWPCGGPWSKTQTTGSTQRYQSELTSQYGPTDTLHMHPHTMFREATLSTCNLFFTVTVYCFCFLHMHTQWKW